MVRMSSLFCCFAFDPPVLTCLHPLCLFCCVFFRHLGLHKGVLIGPYDRRLHIAFTT